MLGEEMQLKVDGIELKGWVYDAPSEPLSTAKEDKPMLILCHGIPRGENHPAEEACLEEDEGYSGLARRCAEEGFTTFHFNFRGTGESQGNFDLKGWTRDLAAFLECWKETNEAAQNGFYLWGFSAGAAVATCVAVEEEMVKGVALTASPAEFHSLFQREELPQIVDRFRRIGLIRDPQFPPLPEKWLAELLSVNPLQIIDRIAPRPLLIVHGAEDELIPTSHAHRLYEQAGHPKTLQMMSGAGHQLRKHGETVEYCLEWFKNL